MSSSDFMVSGLGGLPSLAPDEEAVEEYIEHASVRVAVPLKEDERTRLQALLEHHFRQPLEMEVRIDPGVIGGVWVRVGDIIIDGSLRGRLEALRHHLRSECRFIISCEPSPVDVHTRR